MSDRSGLVGVGWHWLGRQPFAAMVERNRAAAAAVAHGAAPEVVFFEPAAPVYALGRRAQTAPGRAQIASSLAACAALQIAVLEVDRGGLGTLHAPGQIVAFLAVPCSRWQARHLCDELLNGIEILAQRHGVAARADLADDVGVWTVDGKLASLGLRLRDDVAQHGVAINIAVERGLVHGLILCGKSSISLANLDSRQAPIAVDLGQWAAKLAQQWQLASRNEPPEQMA